MNLGWKKRHSFCLTLLFVLKIDKRSQLRLERPCRLYHEFVSSVLSLWKAAIDRAPLIRLHTLTFCFLKSGFPLKHHNSWFQKFVWFVLKSLCCSRDPFLPCSPFYRRIWIFIFLLIWLACRNQAGAGAASHPKPAGVTSMVVALWHLRPWLVVWSSLEIVCCKGSSRFFWRASCS